MTTPTNKTLLGKIEEVDKKVDKKHGIVMQAIETVSDKLNNYIASQEGYARGLKEAKSSTLSNIPPEVWGIIRALLVVIFTLLGAKWTGIL